MFNFGCSNATITKLYRKNLMSKTPIGGEPILANPTVLAHPCWFEKSKAYQRQIEGDDWRADATVTCAYHESFSEGDIIAILPTKYGSETQEPEYLWRIANLDKITSFSFINNRIKQMELSLIANPTS
jgi:hypothetical protein